MKTPLRHMLKSIGMYHQISGKRSDVRIGPKQQYFVTRCGTLENVIMNGGKLTLRPEGVLNKCEIYKGTLVVSGRAVAYNVILHPEAKLIVYNGGHARNVVKHTGAQTKCYPGSEYEAAKPDEIPTVIINNKTRAYARAL